MVDSAKGITNFHSPNDIIMDASMPAMIRNGGRCGTPTAAQGREGRDAGIDLARIYQEMINFCKWHGAFDPPKTMGTVPNVSLMAQQAEEYGSPRQDLPEIPEDGVANITDLATGEVLLSQNVEAGDIWRMCQVQGRGDPRLGEAGREPAPATPACPWCSGSTRVPSARGQLRSKKVKMYLHEHDTTGLDIQILSQVRAPALHAGARDPWPGHHQRHRQHPARLPDRPVPHHGTGHLGQDAVHRA